MKMKARNKLDTKTKPVIFFVLSVLLLIIASCSSQEKSDGNTTSLEGKVVLTGSSTVAPLAAEIAKAFESLHSKVRIDVQTGGSSRGVADTKRGLADIGMVSRDLKSEESNLQAFTIARDGICIIVHKNNPVESLTNEQIVAIYTGNIKNWNEVGGNDAPITVVNKAEGRSTLELFLSYFALDNVDINAHVIIGDNQQGIKTVVGNPNAISYVSVGAAEYDSSHGTSIKLLPLDSHIASIENVSIGKFPLSRPLNLVTKLPPEGLVKEFIEFASSSLVHDIIQEQYFVPIAK